MEEQVHHLTVRSATRNLREVRQFVEEHARNVGLSDEAIDRFRLAVDEACTNVIEHAYHGDESAEILVTIRAGSDRFTVIIRDWGDGFQPQNYKSPNLLDMVEQRRDGGFGVHLMRRLMDRVEYRRRGDYNEVKLTKYVDDFGQNKG